MNKFKHFLGIDVSKDYFDAVVLVAGKKENAIHNQFSNDLKGIKSLVVWLKEQDADFENTLVCLEHTGMYATPRQLACYTGVVPFEYTSGKSVRAKPKVHYMANKKLKKQLHMCALSAITSDPELKHYFERKVAEGKSKMLVINNIRNKIVHRICACIRNNKAFEKRQVA